MLLARGWIPLVLGMLGGEPHPDPGRGPWGGGPGGGHPAGSGSSGRVRRLRRGFTTYGPE